MSAAIIILGVPVVVGIVIGLWGEFTEQRRTGKMAENFKSGRKA